MQPGDDDDDEKRVLNHRDQLMCVQTVFSVLSGQGECLNIDPLRFYTHLYRNLMHINAGWYLLKNDKQVDIALVLILIIFKT